MSIRSKIILFLTLVLLVLSAAFSGIWYRDTKALMDTYLYTKSDELMGNAYGSLSYLLADTEYMMSMIIMNQSSIVEPLDAINRDALLGNPQFTYRQLQSKWTIDEYIGSLYGYKYYITGISIISLSGHEFKIGTVLKSRGDILQLVQNIEADEMRRKMIMLPPEASEQFSVARKEYEAVVPAVRAIFNKAGDVVGYAALYFDYRVIDEMFSNNLPEGSLFQVCNQDGQTIYTNYPDEESHNSYVWNDFDAENVGWILTMGIPSDAIIGEINQTVQRTLMTFILIYVGIMIFAIRFSYGLTNEVKKLNHAMTEVAHGNLDVRVQPRTRDEIGNMGLVFNDMAEQTQELITKVTNQEEQKRRVEIDFLQAQINPHFISNTLNTVIWMAGLQGAEHIQNLLRSLITLLQSVMRRGVETVTVAEEFQHIKSYIDIVKSCGTVDFTVEYHLSEETSQAQMLRFILQPIIENAIFHGLNGLTEREGILSVSAESGGGQLILTVRDNGVGMSRQQINMLLSGEVQRKGSHSFSSIGIRNVNERIQLFYGSGYGVAIQSIPEAYTIVTVTLPMQDMD